MASSRSRSPGRWRLRWRSSKACSSTAVTCPLTSVVEKVKKNNNPNFGFNAETETFEDLFKAGVIDPLKVARTALQNASSIAGLMLTTEAAVVELPEKTAFPPPPEMMY